VQGTPSIFVNGNFVTPGYVPSYDEVLKAVEAELAK
jgi:protein-disulfide isomerase